MASKPSPLHEYESIGSMSSDPQRRYEAGRFGIRIEVLGRLTVRESLRRAAREALVHVAKVVGRVPEVAEEIDPSRNVRYSRAPMQAAPEAADKRVVNGVGMSAEKLRPWVDDRVGLWPVGDLGGPMSAYAGPGDAGLIGVLARIELNEEDGERDLTKGLPKNPLQPPPAEA